jgi:hypothetical protein
MERCLPTPETDLDASLLPERVEPEVNAVDQIIAADFTHEGCEGWTAKECGGHSYMGGRNECGANSVFTTVLSTNDLRGTQEIIFRAKIWTVDSWDNEVFTINIIDQEGNVIGSHEQQA